MSVNKVILIGNVGKDPDIRYFEANRAAANFTLATTERAHKGANDQIIPERTEWHNIVVRGGLVQVVEKYVHKGSKLYIEGKIRSRTYVDRENQNRFVTEILVDELELLSRREPRDTAPPTTPSATSESHSQTTTPPTPQPSPPTSTHHSSPHNRHNSWTPSIT